MKIALLNPPYLPGFSRFSRSPAVTRSGTIYYPIWHAYAAGLLEREGHEVMLIDAPAQRLTMTDCLSLIKDFSPGMTAVYTSTPSIVNDIECAAAIKIIMPSSFMALTGPHVSALPDQTLSMDERIDAVAIGEYDLTLLELASTIESGGDIDGVPGLVIRTNGKVEPTAARAHIEDLDSLPFVSSVYKRHARIEDYFYAHCRYPVVSIFTSRGCAARCDYCVYPQTVFGRRHRQRSPENIVEEFRYIEKELPQTKEVLIDDDTFSFDKAHTLEFAELMIRSRVKLPWTVECRANLDFETLSAMKRAGCRLVVAGFESADDAILRPRGDGRARGAGRLGRGQGCSAVGRGRHSLPFGSPGRGTAAVRAILSVRVHPRQRRTLGGLPAVAPPPFRRHHPADGVEVGGEGWPRGPEVEAPEDGIRESQGHLVPHGL